MRRFRINAVAVVQPNHAILPKIVEGLVQGQWRDMAVEHDRANALGGKRLGNRSALPNTPRSSHKQPVADLPGNEPDEVRQQLLLLFERIHDGFGLGRGQQRHNIRVALSVG